MARKNDYIQEIDKFVGGKIYSLRLAKGLSRQQLAKVVEVTHQQLQKYEKGTNRISVGRLVLIAKALGKSVNYFYEGLEAMSQEPVLTQHQRMCIEVSRNFMKIESTEHQNAVNTLVKSLVRPIAA
jgi:transcriptional regulator with XRE-family HTH domain